MNEPEYQSEFRVSPTESRRDILFELMVPADKVTREKLVLKDKIGSALIVLRVIFPPGERFDEYYSAVLSLAQLGLVGRTANPEASDRALQEMKKDVVAREAGRIKNQYMKRLGLVAAAFAAAILVVLIVVRFYYPQANILQHLLFFLIGSVVGVWISFGTRKPTMAFDDLHVLEEDRLEPTVRLSFSGLLALVLALAFHLRVVTVTLGALSSDSIDTNMYAALFLGLLAGVSEKALSTQVTKHATTLVNGA